MDGLCFGEVDRRMLQQLWQTTDDASLCRRVQAILAFIEGRPVASVARWHGVSRQTIYAWIERFQSESDPLALQDQKRTGRPRDWTAVTHAAFQDCLRWPPGNWGYPAVSWTVLLLQNWLAECAGRTCSETTIRTEPACNGLQLEMVSIRSSA